MDPEARDSEDTMQVSSGAWEELSIPQVLPTFRGSPLGVSIFMRIIFIGVPR